MQPSQLFAAIRDALFAHSGLSLFRPVCLPAEPSCTAHCRLTSGEGSQNFMVTRIATGASLRGHRRWPPPPPASTATSLMLPGPTLLLHHCRSMDALDQLGDQVGLWEGGLQAAILAAWQAGGAWTRSRWRDLLHAA